MKFAALTALALVSCVMGRTFTVYNKCPFTIWPALFTDLNVGTAKPNHPTGWTAPANSKVSFSVPDDWRSGRIWGRRNCGDFSKIAPTEQCLTGGCNGGLLCDKRTGTGVPPATVAEFTLGGTTGVDWYDVSLVDGYNLPVRISNTAGCPVADCLVDLGPKCPGVLKGPFDRTGSPVGCKSACFANLDGNQGNSPNCCSGSYSTPDKCPPSGVQYYDYFKRSCPRSYVYAYDESSNTALFTCPSSKRADYTITFCP
ncbi:thaumatin-like protein [Coprinellus micaceus]|uniref:Thaumatin-like protein n=1 Tax=Coprinellus micaceus TaxID=71717 RepID=A0A4Y7TGB5_COPMI|nr:thaumatin-like protein [Coprinellus micaceus]